MRRDSQQNRICSLLPLKTSAKYEEDIPFVFNDIKENIPFAFNDTSTFDDDCITNNPIRFPQQLIRRIH